MEQEYGFTDELLEQMENFFINETFLLSSLKELDEVRVAKLYPLIFSLIDTSKSMVVLGKHNLINDMYMVSRSFIERLVNFLYLQVCDEEEFNRYMLHTTQKVFRKLDRSIETSKGSARILFQGKESVTMSNLDEAIGLFTSKSGKEITHWTPVSLDKRIEKICSTTNTKPYFMLLCKLNIYEDASEALHGTLYGSTFHLGVFTPNTSLKNPKDLENHFISLKTTVYWTTGVLTYELFSTLFELYDIKEVFDKSKDILNEAKEIMKRSMEVDQEGSNIS